MGILDEDVARVRAAADLVELASEKLALRKVGRRFVGLCPFHTEKSPSFSVNAEEGLYYCLAGETGVLTWDGVRPIRELAGTTQRVLTERGRWVDAPFYSFGIQPLMRVTLTRNRQVKVIHATPEHRWLIRGRGTHRYERLTNQLIRGHSLAWSFPANRTRLLGDLSPFGVAHGITYGDGCHFNSMASADLHGDKDAQLLKWFPLSRTYALTSANGKPFTKVLDLPLHFKRRPSLEEAPTYLAGWLAGYLAADGHVAADGTVMLNSADRDDLEFVRQVCTRLGVGTYGITTQHRVGFGAEPSALHRVHFIAEDLDERFFLIDEHRQRFASATKSWVRRGWVVQSVEPTDRIEEVFCAVVEGTHSFTLEDNILTGNCFGCGAKGDVITFVRDIEHVDFAGAVEYLAGRTGIQLRYDDASVSREKQQRNELVELMAKAVDFYHDRLLSHADAGRARGYLRSRGYERSVVEEFRIGWAPDDWDVLARALRAKPDLLKATGLGFVNRRDRVQDAFRGRIMFPIFDVRGDPVAFGARRLEGDGPKYLNSQETVLYSKSRTLYGLNWSKTDITTAGEAIVCEGYTDVIGFAQAGMPRAVATCGTALADGHIGTLKNFARRLVLAYDADAAGQAAAARFYEWEQKFEIDLFVAALPEGADPADVARDDPAALAAAVENARPFLAFRVDRVLSQADLREPEGRARAAEAAMAAIREHPSELVRDQYLMEVASRCRLEPDLLRSGRLRSEARPPIRATAQNPATRIQLPRDAEEQALLLAVHRRDEVLPRLHEVLFAGELSAQAYEALTVSESLHDAIAATVHDDVASMLQRLAVEDDEGVDPDDVLARLAREAARRAINELKSEMTAADDPGAYSEAIAWLAQTIELLALPDARLGATEQLVAWLADRAEEQG